jgi:hypothetical protein
MNGATLHRKIPAFEEVYSRGEEGVTGVQEGLVGRSSDRAGDNAQRENRKQKTEFRRCSLGLAQSEHGLGRFGKDVWKDSGLLSFNSDVRISLCRHSVIPEF